MATPPQHEAVRTPSTFPAPAGMKAFLQSVLSQLHEHELLKLEQRMLQAMAREIGALSAEGAAPRVDWRAMEVIREHNIRRVAELEARAVNRAVFGLRRAVLGLPAPIGRPVRAGIRSLMRLAPAPRPALRALPATLPLAQLPPPSLREPVGVVMHVFYPELAAEMRGYLEAIPGPVDVYLSTDTSAKADSLRQAFAGWSTGRVEVRLAPNRGRDIAPKLVTFRDVYDRHAVVLHLHSKKSPHDSALRLWRCYLLETLVGNRESVSSILAALEHRPDLGMVAAEHYFAVSNGIDWGGNFELAQELAGRMGIALDPAAPIDFPSGSMFWLKSAALKPLLALDLKIEDFPPEDRQVDGTLAHAVERLYFEICRAAGFGWLKVRKPDFFQ